jgi:UDP-galactopyranose mutase
MVLNWPSKDYPWIRTHETKHASMQKVKGTVITTEFTGGEGRYYPVPGLKGKFRNRNELYKTMISNRIGALGVETLFVGRLANFLYLDMDDVIRQALDTVRSAVGVTTEAA